MPTHSSAPRRRRWSRGLVWLLLLAALVFGAALGQRAPAPADEPRFVLAAKHMVESGDWLVPMRGSERYAEKPPVFMWAIAASAVVVRDWNVAFLLPSLLAALATLWLTGDLARRLWRPGLAPWAAGALLVSLQFGLQAGRAQIDMVLVALTTLSLWGLLRHLLRGPDWRAAWLGAFAAGVGTVTKGVGFLPLLVLLPWLLLRWRRPSTAWRPAPGDGWRWAGLALAFVAGTAVWLGPLAVELLRVPSPDLRAYAAELLLRQTGERYANAWHHVQPPWYYLQSMATVWLPGVLLVPWLLPAWWRRLRRGDARLWLLLGWALLVLLFFSASPGKREVYIFPVLPALCVAAAPLLPALLPRRGPARVLRGWLGLLAALLVVAGASGLAATGGLGGVEGSGLAERLAGAGRWAVRLATERALAPGETRQVLATLLALGLALLPLAAWARRGRLHVALPAATALLWLAVGLGIGPALDRSSSGRGLMETATARIGAGGELALVAWREQFLLQAPGSVVEFGFKRPVEGQWRDAAAWLAAAPSTRWVLVPEPALDRCVDRRRAAPLGRASRLDWWLVPASAMRAGCDPGTSEAR